MNGDVTTAERAGIMHLQVLDSAASTVGHLATTTSLPHLQTTLPRLLMVRMGNCNTMNRVSLQTLSFQCENRFIACPYAGSPVHLVWDQASGRRWVQPRALALALDEQGRSIVRQRTSGQPTGARWHWIHRASRHMLFTMHSASTPTQKYPERAIHQ